MAAANATLLSACEGLWGRCAGLEEALERSMLRNQLLEERVSTQDDVRRLMIRAATAEADVTDLREQLANQTRRVEALSAQSVRLQTQLEDSRAAEDALRAEAERRTEDFKSSRLALLLRTARANNARTQMEAQAIALKAWAVEQIGEQAMDAFNEPEYEECFAPLEEMREWDWEWNT